MRAYDLSDEDEEHLNGLKYIAAVAGALGLVLVLLAAVLAYSLYAADEPVLGSIVLGFTICFIALRVICRALMRQVGPLMGFAKSIIALETLWPTMSLEDYQAWYQDLNNLRRQLWQIPDHRIDDNTLRWRNNLYQRWLEVIRQCPYPLK